jgi:predicted methyltransferase
MFAAMLGRPTSLFRRHILALTLLTAGVSSNACGGSAPKEPTAPSTSAATTSKSSEPKPAESAPKPTLPPTIQAIVDAPDRSPDDKAIDAGRHPGELLAFFGIAPGMKVAEIAAGTGYTTELLARAVAPNGVVYAQNNKFVVEKFAAAPWAARLAKPVNKNVVRVDRELEDPLPPEAKDLDAVVVVLFYHDTFWLKADRAKMNAAVFKSLKPGGVYGIVDHSARPGVGANDVQTLHRIEEKVVREEVEKAGFKLAAEGDFLRNASDTRDWNDSASGAGARRGTSDRFVLKFVKP